MSRLLARSIAGPALGLLLLAAADRAAGENVPLRMVPKPVLESVRARFEGARMTGAERDRGPGQLLYEVAIRLGTQRIDVVVTPEGTIVLIKKEMTAARLPRSVLRVLEERYPGSVYGAVEEVFRVEGGRETLARYEVDLVTTRRERLEIRVGADGTILDESK